MFKKLLMGSLVISLLLPQMAFAATEAATEEVLVEEEMIEAVPIGDYVGGGDMYPYYGNGISFTVSLVTYAEPEKAVIYGDYYYSTSQDDDINTRQELVSHLNSIYSAVKPKLDAYGTVTKTGSSVYNGYSEGVDQVYDGYLNIRIDLDKVSYEDEVKVVLAEYAFNSWTDMTVSEEDKIEAESSVAAKLKTLIDKKKGVYETILGYALSKITGLNIYSWPDAYQYNSETGMVPLTVTANVSYTAEE